MTRIITRDELRDWVDNQPVAGPLTAFTGRRRFDETTTYVMSFEVSQTAMTVVLLSFILVGMPVTGILLAIASAFTAPENCWFLLPLPVLISAVALWLFVARERRGLRLLRYQGILDRRRAAQARAQLFIGPNPVQPTQLAELIPVVIDTPERLLPGAMHAMVPGRPLPAPSESRIASLTTAFRREPDTVTLPTAWDVDATVIAQNADPWSTPTGKD